MKKITLEALEVTSFVIPTKGLPLEKNQEIEILAVEPSTTDQSEECFTRNGNPECEWQPDPFHSVNTPCSTLCTILYECPTQPSAPYDCASSLKCSKQNDCYV